LDGCAGKGLDQRDGSLAAWKLRETRCESDLYRNLDLASERGAVTPATAAPASELKTQPEIEGTNSGCISVLVDGAEGVAGAGVVPGAGMAAGPGVLPAGGQGASVGQAASGGHSCRVASWAGAGPPGSRVVP